MLLRFQRFDFTKDWTKNKQKHWNLKCLHHKVKYRNHNWLCCLLSRVVQFKKRIRIWKITKANYLAVKRNLHKNFDYSILLTFSSTNVNYFKFRLFITITTNQKHQDDWKSKHILSKTFIQNEFSIFKLCKNILQSKRRLIIKNFFNDQEIA